MTFFTTKYINELIKNEYYIFVQKNYGDVLSNSNKYIYYVENKISEYLGGGYVKLVDSGTTALQFGLLALGVGVGDEVILPSNTYSATAIAITNIGAIPVFCDINLDNYTIDVLDIKNKITEKTKVIIPVHLYGYPCNMEQICLLAKSKNIFILEDASHAFGGEYKGEKLGTIGNIGAYSCHLTKNFGTFGNGGIFYTKKKDLFDKIQKYIYPDIQNKEVLVSGRTPATIGVMDALVLLFKLKYIDSIIQENQKLYDIYYKKYKDIGFIFPQLDFQNNVNHIRNLVVLTDNRELYISAGLGQQYYNIDLMKTSVFGYGGKLKNTEFFFQKNFGINFYFGLKKDKIDLL